MKICNPKKLYKCLCIAALCAAMLLNAHKIRLSQENEARLAEAQAMARMAKIDRSVSFEDLTTVGMAAALELHFTDEEALEYAKSREGEYDSYAIAKVSDYVNVRTEPNTDSGIVGRMYDGSVAQILETVGDKGEEWFRVVSGSVEGYIRASYFIYGEAATAEMDEHLIRTAHILADRLNIRTEPNTEAPRIGYAMYGESLKALELLDGWIKVETAGGREGYISQDYATLEENFIYAKTMSEVFSEEARDREMQLRETEEDNGEGNAPPVLVSPPATDYASVSEFRKNVVDYALQYVGTRYVSGGQSLAGGTDCSGFTCYVFREFGVSLSRTPQGQWGGNGRRIDLSEAQPGDIICYSSNGSKCTHVGLYMGGGQIVHEANRRKGCMVSPVDYDTTFIGVINVID